MLSSNSTAGSQTELEGVTFIELLGCQIVLELLLFSINSATPIVISREPTSTALRGLFDMRLLFFTLELIQDRVEPSPLWTLECRFGVIAIVEF